MVTSQPTPSTPSAATIVASTGLTKTDIDRELAVWKALLTDSMKGVGYSDEEIAKECMQHALRNLTQKQASTAHPFSAPSALPPPPPRSLVTIQSICNHFPSNARKAFLSQFTPLATTELPE